MAEKRKRSPNWLPSEKKLLLQIVKQHFSIIKNKKTDGATNQKKAAEWKIMSEEYNSQTMHIHRTAENLKAQWESMKKAVRKEASNKRKSLIQTGGETPRPNTEDPFYKRVLGLMEPSVVGLHDLFDNDIPDAESESLDTVSEEVIESFDSHDLAHIKVLEVEPPIPVYTLDPLAVKDPDRGNCTKLLLQTPVSKNLLVEEINCMPVNKNEGPSTRQPKIPVSSLESYHTKKVEAIQTLREHANDERRETKSLHDISMQIKQEELKIKQEELKIKQEELKQTKIKTRLLLLELRLKEKKAS